MRPLQMKELSQLAQGLESLISCRLQKVESGENWLSFMFYGRGEEHSLLLSLNAKCPILLPLRPPQGFKKKVIPALLFIKAHFADHFLSSVTHEIAEGRILKMKFSNGGVLEFRLFPHGQNLLATTPEGKKISMNKVADVSAPPIGAAAESEPREMGQIIDEWLQENAPDSRPKGSASAIDLEKAKNKALEKKKRALELVEKEVALKTQEPYREIGEWLKAHQTLEVHEAWAAYIDRKKNFAQNLNAIFEKAKQNSEKLNAALERAQLLRDEIAAIEAGTFQVQVQKRNSTLKDAGARGRTVELSTGHSLYLGRNAEENLKILRAAQGWDFWIHIKDRPGSHGVLRRNKNESIPDKALLEALQNLLRHQFGSKAKNYIGNRYECLVTECRFVKPIKGDKLGRVHYQKERVMTVQFKG
jgi:hypothetical protein